MASLAGSFLVARSSLRDGFFGRSVILLLQHGEDGAFGLVLNRPAKTEDIPFPIFIGGPCKTEGLLMIHGRLDWVSDEENQTMQICPGVFLGTTEHFEKIENANEDSPRFRVFTGYAGWAPQQLEGELNQGSWIVLPARGELVFETPINDLWEKLAPTTLHNPSLN